MLYVAIAIIFVAILILYMIVLKTKPTIFYKPVETPSKVPEKEAVKELTDKEKMFQTYFPKVEKGIQMDYPLKPIGCCPPSKELSKDLPIADLPMCYANQSKTYLGNGIQHF